MAEKKKSGISAKLVKFGSDFKAFISRGNVIDMAVGLIIGSAFSGIVSSLVNILLSLCTWPLPGGILGLVTVLPALNDNQKGIAGIGQYFQSADLENEALYYAQNVLNIANPDATALANASSALTSLYKLHGGLYCYNGAAIIDWGAFINAFITFLIIAFVLFIIVRAMAGIRNKKAEMEAKVKEEYYKLHPSERPAPASPGAPTLTELDVLKQIRDELKRQNETPAK